MATGTMPSGGRQETDLVPMVITYLAAIVAMREVHNGCGHLAFWR